VCMMDVSEPVALGQIRGSHAIRPTAEPSKSSAMTTARTANAIMVLFVSVVTMTAFGTPDLQARHARAGP
jgi:hypothetical protein